MSRFPAHLLKGYQNFRSGRFAVDGERYRVLAEDGQKPETMVLACCDSRAAPDTVFNCRAGDIFVVRSIAGLVPPYPAGDHSDSTLAALEYAVQALQVKNIVVLGHSRCGGIQAAMTENPAPLTRDNFLGNWLQGLCAAMAGHDLPGGLDIHERQTAYEKLSVKISLENLATYAFIKNKVEQGHLALHGAWFAVNDGTLWVMDQNTGDFIRA